MSGAEEMLELHLKSEQITYAKEVKAIEGRNFRFDFACFAYEYSGLTESKLSGPMVLVEVQGGAWMKPVLGKDGKYHSRGAHGTGKSQERDCEKLSLAAVNGYRCIVVTPAQIKSGQAISWIKAALL